MNVLISVPWDNLGGVCNVVNAVARHLRNHGHGVWLLLPGDTDEPELITSRIGVPAYRLNLRPPENPRAPVKGKLSYLARLPRTRKRLNALLSQLNVDVVNVHFPHDASVYFSDVPQKLITSIHGADLLPYSNDTATSQNSVNSVIAHSDAVVAPSMSFVAAASKKWPILNTRTVSVIPNGIDPAELGYSPEKPWSEAEPPYILSVATLVPYKGVDVIIRAFAQMAKEFPDVRLKLVSGGPSYGDLLRLAGELGVSERIDFVGAVDRRRIAEYVGGASVFVLASRSDSESFGIAAAEAMALDRAVSVSNVGALPEMVQHERTGLLVPPGDAQALAAAMRRALSDRPLRERLGRAAGEKVRREYLWSRTGSEYEALLRRVLAQ